jgi:hypothetical protein
MKINGVRAMIIVSLSIIILYILGLFLPIIKNTKNTKSYNLFLNKREYVKINLLNKEKNNINNYF